jgi:transcription termination factor Rho
VASLDDLHLAQLHERAAALGVPGYRKLKRDDLIAEIEKRGDGEEPKQSRRRSRGGRGRGRGRERLKDEPARRRPSRDAEPEPEDEETEEVSGVLELTGAGHGFLRLKGLDEADGDVYVSAAQIRRCELRPGDDVSGPARAPRRGERHRALVHVDRVNDAEPPSEPRPELGELTAAPPRRRLALAVDLDDVLVRAADLLAPLAFGQRVLVSAAPRSGRTTLLRGIARAVTAGGAAELIVLLVDERPEEAGAWREALPDASLAIATAEMSPAEQVRLANLASERARRRAEAGADVVFVCDSLSRLAVAAEGTAEVKRLFGSGREIEGDETGSLTVIATALSGLGDDGAAERAVVTTENALVTLDPDLAAAGVFPALRAAGCRVSGEEELRSPEELEAARRLRSLLADLAPVEAAALLRERIEASADNAELLGALGQ